MYVLWNAPKMCIECIVKERTKSLLPKKKKKLKKYFCFFYGLFAASPN